MEATAQAVIVQVVHVEVAAADNMLYADIIVDISLQRLDKTFEYIIPDELVGKVMIGSQVVAPFGNGDRKIKGYVIDITRSPNFDVTKLKPIEGILKDSLPVEAKLIAVAAFIKRNYGSTMNQAMKTVIPIKKKEAAKEKKVVFLNMDEIAAKDELNQLLARKNHSIQKEKLMVELIDKKQLEWELVTGKLGVSSAIIRELEKTLFLRVETTLTYRRPEYRIDTQRETVTLNDEQRAAVDTFSNDYDMGKRDVYLIHGVTGSGKTEVYMEMMEHVINEGKQVIVLIPEIALTYQTLMRFYTRFGETVSIINSKMTPSERYDQFERAKNGEINVIIGPRSALFTPFSNLGLIIIDEEHESTYKSETVPKYHARETAIFRAANEGAAVVLGSATPSLESYSRAASGQYHLLELKKRATNNPLPNCQIVDMREELMSGNKTMISRRLADAIADRLDKGQQTMLFLNRRGISGFVSCRECGEVIKCPHCDVSMSLHNDDMMRCHYCGYTMPKPKQCPKCGSKLIGQMKAGTQKLEQTINEMFPGARVLRMDADTTRNKNGHEEILSAFSSGEADILIGTQMIVKGHDFANVTLVGVIVADISLNEGDYRSGERTFQLLTQAVGRAGRGAVLGEAIIQTYRPDNYAILASAKQDFNSFYEDEISYRKLLSYPPIGHILQVQITGPKYEDTVSFGKLLAERIKANDPSILTLGPTDAFIGKLKDMYRRVIYVKDDDYDRLVEVKNGLEKFILEDRRYKSVNVWFDFDPMSGF